MSGIAGIVRFDRAVDAAELTAMLRAMATRGPDRRAFACMGGAGFGHALLATTPEALAEQQPWRHDETGCLVVSDSRLDNRPQLLRALGIERPADQVGDGELLHAAWHRWGEDLPDHLRGDFAFAIWSPRQGELFLARDPMGVRPLAFHFSPGRLFVFGSTAEVVLAHVEVPDALDEGRVADALLGETEGIDEVCTFFAAITRIPPAHWLRVRNGRLERRRYWRPIGEHEPTDLPLTEGEWVEAQRERLDIAVRQRLRSHRPVGSMLSGGLDSSTVVALAGAAGRSAGKAPFPVFSAINSADADCRETLAIHRVVAHVGCEPKFVDLQEFKSGDSRALRLWDEAGEPFDSTMALVAALYEAAESDGVASLMDGLPADNLYVTGNQARRLFAKGDWIGAWRTAVAQWSAPEVRHPALHALRVMAGCIMPPRMHAMRDGLAAAREYRRLIHASPVDRAFAERIGLAGRYRRYRRTIGGSHQWHASGEALSSMTAPYITAAIERYNRLASLYGVEPRHPFADRDLVEFQAWVPIHLRHRAGHRKWVLRKAAESLLPDDVAWRRDKSHLGRDFTLALVQANLATRGIAADSLAQGWLDLPKMKANSGDIHASLAAGVPTALMAGFWWSRMRAGPMREPPMQGGA